MLSPKRVAEMLRYEPDTGLLFWRVARTNGVKAGDQAGSISSDGYRRIRLFATEYRAHRVAWCLYYGEWPTKEIDHINLKKTDNRICNLRQASRSENRCNSPRSSNNKAGIKGVCYLASIDKWQVSIMKNGKNHYLGWYATAQKAQAAYAAKARELHGEFARF